MRGLIRDGSVVISNLWSSPWHSSSSLLLSLSKLLTHSRVRLSSITATGKRALGGKARGREGRGEREWRERERDRRANRTRFFVHGEGNMWKLVPRVSKPAEQGAANQPGRSHLVGKGVRGEEEGGREETFVASLFPLVAIH